MALSVVLACLGYALIVLSFLIYTNAITSRYIKTDVPLFGEFVPKGIVLNRAHCALFAHKANSIAYQVRPHAEGNPGLDCQVLTKFDRFERNLDNVASYLLTTNKEATNCPSGVNVLDVISGECAFSEEMCAEFAQIKMYCDFVGVDVPDCTFTKDTISITDFTCPFGKYLVGAQKERFLCCNTGTTLKEVVNKISICCKPDDNYEPGLGCCPKGETGYQADGRYLCCDEDKKVIADEEGRTGCCAPETSIHFGEENWACCTAEEHFVQGDYDEVGCCGRGLELGGFVKGTAVCCKPGQIWREEWEFCCDVGEEFMRSDEGGTKCCLEGQYVKGEKLPNLMCCTSGDACEFQ